MNVLHIIPSFFPATYFGGPIVSTKGLCDALQTIPEVNIRVLTTDSAGPGKLERHKVDSIPVIFPAGYQVFYCPRNLGLDISWSLFTSIWNSLRWADVVHLTGVYSSPTIPTLLACKLLDVPVVWSPRGSLQRWQGSTRPRLKRVWEFVCNSLINPERVVLHVTSKGEYDSSSVRINHASSTIIPNGVNLPELGTSRIWRPNGALRILYMGRLHPIKGIENLLTAMVDSRIPYTTLVVCGDGEPSYLTLLHNYVISLKLQGRVTFAGEVKAEAKLAAFAAADVCVVPSFTENFGMVVAESLAHAVPVVVSKGAPWAEVESRSCGLWVENTPEALAFALQTISACDLASMGVSGRAWMQNDYGWSSVAQDMYSLYRKIILRKKK
jgi:glycosyltransferase involved in cell wall biosynthesis